MFECQPTTDQSGQVFTPNIPDFYFNHTNAAAFRTGDGANLTTLSVDARTTFIFTTPPESACSGIVTAFQYCYHLTVNSSRRNIFRFLSLSRNGLSFTVNIRYARRAPSPTNITCSYNPSTEEKTCCVTRSIRSQMQFPITSSNYTFGVVMLEDNSARLLTFPNNTDTKYRLPYFIKQLSNSDTQVNSTFTLENTIQNNGPLPLLRLLIGKNVHSSHSYLP